MLQTTVGSGSGPGSGSITAGGSRSSNSNNSPNVINDGGGTSAGGMGCGANDEQCVELKELVVLVNEHRVVRFFFLLFFIYFYFCLKPLY